MNGGGCSCTVRGINPKVYGDGRDALVGASYPFGLRFDLRPNLLKVHKLLVFAMQELGILCSQKEGGREGQGGRDEEGRRTQMCKCGI